MTNHVMNTYARLPVEFVKGEGVYLWDAHGTRYLDALSGIAVCNLGHCHPVITQAICEQAGQLIHTSNIVPNQFQEALADHLAQVSGMDKVFFANSGAEANEGLIKLARLFGHKKGIENPEIIVMTSSFHGRTLATLSATGNRKIQAGFEPLVKGFLRAPYGDVQAIVDFASRSKNIVAIMVEPVQGEGGVNIAPEGYLAALRAICDQQDWLLMIDEVQTGVGRTGKMFAFQHANIVPDVMSLAKGLGNGVPIGAFLAAGKAAQVLQPGNHGSTFGGNLLVTRAALAVLQVMQKDNIPAAAQKIGDYIATRLREELAHNPHVETVRNLGMMIGVELKAPIAGLVLKALQEHHIVINVTAEKVIRLLPPLIMTPSQADELVTQLVALLQ